MDSSLSEADEGTARLSLSLVSYGSDIEDADSITAVSNLSSSETLVPNLLGDVTQQSSSAAHSSSSEEDELISNVAEQLGLSGVSQEKLDQFSHALERMMASQEKYLQTKMLLEAVKNVAKSSTKLSAQTTQRVNQVLNHISLLDYVTPFDVDSADGVFGLSLKHLEEQLPNKLTAVDKKQLREVVEEEIALRHEKLLMMNKRHTDILSKITGSVCNARNSAEQTSTRELLLLRHKLDTNVSTNEGLLVELDKVLSNLAKLKLESLDRLNNTRLDTFGTRCELLKNHIQSVHNQIVKGIYLEDEHLIDAHNELKKNLELAVIQAKSELSYLRKKDAEFEKLQGTHFDDLVKEYHDLKSQIAQKEYALKNLV